MALPGYERLGVFYLGREIGADDTASGAELLYDSRDLTTHAVCIGMTGSGKTGLCISLLEEAVLDGVPVIAIDPKGDLGNLLLTFPELAPADFAPWVDAGDAARKGVSVDDLAASTATRWRDGLAQWNEDGDRIRRLREAAEFAIYTPGSTSGRPLSILRSFAAPSASQEPSAVKERVGSAVSGLLALLGIEADPIKSREHILLAAILDAAWRGGNDLDLPAVIQAVQKPPFDKVGVFDVESFYPAKERQELALRINGLLAAPGFSAWLEGDPLDAQRLLHTDAGKPRVSIISIAHLTDAERMFVVTLVANELVGWMRRQTGTTSLRAILYMDEVFGYLPPTAMPPSKPPLLTLMKQARSFGLGVVLATQNPVDLDYKGLGNAGTWFIGRLQTERDKARVIDGLLGAEAAAGLDRPALETRIASLAQRRFLMRNAGDDSPVLFETRWALSYLRGPLTLAEIARLAPPSTTAARSTPAATGQAEGPAPSSGSESTAAAPGRSPQAKPLVPAGLAERYVVREAGNEFRAHVGARVRAHFVDAKSGVDNWRTSYYLAPISDAGVDWAAAEVLDAAPPFLAEPRGARYAPVAQVVISAKTSATWAGQLSDQVYRGAVLELLRSEALKVSGAPGVGEAEFRAQLAQVLRERRDAAVGELRAKYRRKLEVLDERLRKSEQRLAREQAESSSQTTASAIAIGGSLLGALFGGRRGAMSKTASAVRSAGRITKERGDVERAQSDADALRQQVAAVNTELSDEIGRLESSLAPDTVGIERVAIRPRKTDTAIEELALVWIA
jgi:hypothetical protein